MWRPQLCSLTVQTGASLFSSSDLSFSLYGIMGWRTVTRIVLPPWTFPDFYSMVHLTVLQLLDGKTMVQSLSSPFKCILLSRARFLA